MAAFNRLRIQEGQEWLTAFTIRFGKFKYFVMPFGLCNGPNTFQAYINKNLQDVFGEFCTAYHSNLQRNPQRIQEARQRVATITPQSIVPY